MNCKSVFNCCTNSKNPSIDDLIDIGLYKESIHKRINEMCDSVTPQPFIILTMDDNFLHYQNDEQVKELLTKFILAMDPFVRMGLMMGLAIHELLEPPINE